MTTTTKAVPGFACGHAKKPEDAGAAYCPRCLEVQGCEGRMKNPRRGRCARCKVAFLWDASGPRVRLLRDAFCPHCGDKLRQTTHLLKSVPWTLTEPVRRP